MSLIRGIASLCFLAVLVSGCYTTMRFRSNMTLSNSYALEVARSVQDEYKEAPKVDPLDFQPATGGSMDLDESHPTHFGARFMINFRKWYSESSYLGLTSEFLSLYWNIASKGYLYRQQIRYSDVSWWDAVTAEEVAIVRSPSIGVSFGSAISINEQERFVIQYTGSIMWYQLEVVNYEGIDCIGCPNTSRPKGSTTISSGLAWRHAIELGFDTYRAAVWFEFDGLKQITGGLGIVLSDYFLKKD